MAYMSAMPQLKNEIDLALHLPLLAGQERLLA